VGYGLDCRGSISGIDKFFFTSQSPDDLGAQPTSYKMGTGGSFPGGRSVRCMEATIHLHLMPRLRTVELHLHSPISLHGVVLNSLSIGTILPFFNVTYTLCGKIVWFLNVKLVGLKVYCGFKFSPFNINFL
jgi:hypothetical protein